MESQQKIKYESGLARDMVEHQEHMGELVCEKPRERDKKMNVKNEKCRQTHVKEYKIV